MTSIVRSSVFRRVLAFMAAALLPAILLACSGDAGTVTPAPAVDATPVTASVTTDLGFAATPPADWAGAAIAYDELPAEAHDTLALIAAGGPYPYDQDDSTFQNREGRLPDRDLGFYREYTVETPGSSDRGARRFVVGDDAAAYYTDDHYDSFRFVSP